MVGKLGRIGQGYWPIYHLMPMLYASVAFGLRQNDEFLHSTSKAYRKLIKLAKSKPKNSEDTCEITFAMGQAARKAHACERIYRIPESMKEEIAFILAVLMDNSIELATPLGHIVPQDPTWEAAADA